MSKDFQPFHEESGKKEFQVWEYTPVEKSDPPVVDEQIEFAIECERLRNEAKNQGYEEGLQQAASEMEALKKELRDWISFIRNPVQLVDKALSQEIVKTILWICETCIGIEISHQPEKLLVLFEEIKKELPALKKNQQMMMNPDDVEWLKGQLGQKHKDILAVLVADPGLTRGDFYLKSEHGELDGTLKKRLQNLIHAHLAPYAGEMDDE
ncbi:flagellar assembly protein FliH [Legionella spiritensis]|uniref:flagellar assembly protein FliH n=1 Tax=Legionella spiritensis TaxID=452 RepID=UPI000F6C6CEF|nr:flagellar assembly protein FliH [Legionella spiritensis]VEG90564.1 flagellar assembly protein FliH [Legionella spiritensis]